MHRDCVTGAGAESTAREDGKAEYRYRAGMTPAGRFVR
jgi:hypothetical protein